MRIEKATSAMLPALLLIEARCFSDPWQAETVEHLLDRFTVCLDGEVLVGYIVLSSVLDEGGIDNIAVLPEYRRRGVADLLLLNAVARSRRMGLVTLTLEVRAANTPAIRLYEKHGFVKVGRRRNYYVNPREDAILMTLVV